MRIAYGSELIRISDLTEKLRRRSIFLGIASGLAYLHHGYLAAQNVWEQGPWEKHIQHRDITPKSILLKTRPGHDYPQVLISDLSHATSHFETKLTGKYRSAGPEYPWQTTKNDIWSLGAVMQELAIGIPVFIEPPIRVDKKKWRKKAKSRKPRHVDHMYSVYLDRVIQACLTRNEAERPDAEAVVDMIKDGRAAYRGLSAGPPGP